MIKSFKNNLKIFFLYSKFSWKTTFQMRLGVIFFMLGKIFRFVLFFFLIYLIFMRAKMVAGYTINQAIIFYLTFNIIDTASQVFFREVYRFRPLVTSGNFDLVLLKPFHPFLRVLIGGVDFLDVFMLIPYIIITFYLAVHIAGVSPSSLFLYFLLLCNALVIAMTFHIMVLALGILTTEVDHTILIYRDLTTLGRFPLEIYREPIRGLFTFIIPIGIMMSFPPYALFNILSWRLLIYSILASCILLFISLKLWDSALKKYQSWGG